MIDGSGYLFRAFHALPPLHRSDGTPTGAVYGFLRMLTKLVSDHGGESYAIFMDASRGGFRRHIYAAYKAQRPPTPPELISQMSLLREASRCCGFPLLESKEFEADDLIASYTDQARRAEREVVIVSSDKDFLQLVGEGVTILDPVRNRMCGAETAQEKFGVPPRQVIDVQALAGDSSDNVPGVPGIGVKTAARLISSFGDLESLLSRAAEVPQPKRRRSLIEYAAQARLSKRLVTLSRNAPTLLALEQLVWRSPNRRVLEDFLAKNEFRSLLLIFRSLFFAREEQEEQSDAFLEEPLRTPSTLAELRQHIAHFSHSETISLECDSPQGHDTGDKQVSAASVHRFTIGTAYILSGFRCVQARRHGRRTSPRGHESNSLCVGGRGRIAFAGRCIDIEASSGRPCTAQGRLRRQTYGADFAAIRDRSSLFRRHFRSVLRSGRRSARCARRKRGVDEPTSARVRLRGLELDSCRVCVFAEASGCCPTGFGLRDSRTSLDSRAGAHRVRGRKGGCKGSGTTEP